MHLLSYLLAYVVIGVGVGVVSRRYMPGVVPLHYTGLVIASVLASVASGLFVYYMASAEWLVGSGRGTSAYGGADGSTLPGYWLSLFAAMGGAILMAAIYKYVLTRRARAHTV